jgi:hypothetical protein
MILALISQVKGLAAFDDGKVVRFINASRISEISLDDGGYFSKSLSEAPDLESLEVEDVIGLRKHLQVRRNREELLHASLVLLESSWSKEVRRLAGKVLLEKHNPEDWTWVEGVLCSAPLPPSADIDTAMVLCPFHQNFFQEIRSAQEHVKKLDLAWHALSESFFAHETRDQVHAKIVRRGAFRNLLRGGSGLNKNPFARVLNLSSNSVKSSDLSSIGNSHRSTVNSLFPLESGIWDISLWRTACLASEWPVVQSKFSCRGASLISGSDWIRLFGNEHLEVELDNFYDSWGFIRNDSGLSKAVDVIYSIVDDSNGSHKYHFIEYKTISPNHKNSNNLGRYVGKRKGKQWNGVEENLLEKLVSAYFEPGAQGESAIQNKFPVSHDVAGKKYFWVTEDRSSWQKLGEDLHIALNSANNRSSNDLFLNKATRYREWKHLTGGADLNQLVESVSDALSVYALDQIFNKKGFVVYVSYDNESSYNIEHFAPKLPPYAVVLNPAMRTSRIFNGYIAILLMLLRNRLVADIKSGVPKSRCGWVDFYEISKKVNANEAVVERNINELRSNVLNAGFPEETVQQFSNVVRLNPDFAAATDRNFQSTENFV